MTVYPTAQSFKKWVAAARVEDIGEVIHLCIEELRDRIGERQGAEILLGDLKQGFEGHE